MSSAQIFKQVSSTNLHKKYSLVWEFETSVNDLHLPCLVRK
jgi:hypothetical protein